MMDCCEVEERLPARFERDLFVLVRFYWRFQGCSLDGKTLFESVSHPQYVNIAPSAVSYR